MKHNKRCSVNGLFSLRFWISLFLFIFLLGGYEVTDPYAAHGSIQNTMSELLSALGSRSNAVEKLQEIQSPPEGKIYHAVYPGHEGGTGEEDDITAEDVASYKESVGKSAVWVYFSHNWYRDRKFPVETASWIRDAGGVP